MYSIGFIMAPYPKPPLGGLRHLLSLRCILDVQPYLGEIPVLTNISQMGLKPPTNIPRCPSEYLLRFGVLGIVLGGSNTFLMRCFDVYQIGNWKITELHPNFLRDLGDFISYVVGKFARGPCAPTLLTKPAKWFPSKIRPQEVKYQFYSLLQSVHAGGWNTLGFAHPPSIGFLSNNHQPISEYITMHQPSPYFCPDVHLLFDCRPLQSHFSATWR